MRIIINTSNLNMGGGIQVALSFIQECINFPENEYHIFSCNKIDLQIEKNSYPANFYFYLVPSSPSSLKTYFRTNKLLEKLEKQINPNCVFTVFGPSYWTPRSTHLMGFALGYYIYPESPFFGQIGILQRLKINIRKIIHLYFIKKNSSFYYVETMEARNRLAKLLKININQISAFSNTFHSVFENPVSLENVLPEKSENEFRLVLISSYYRHKNMELIKQIIPVLKKEKNIKYTFVLTIEKQMYKQLFEGMEEDVINLGSLPIKKCPKLYSECDALFLPSLVETFTASYPEAMKMRKPIITSDLPFAREICDDAAIYFDCLDPASAANSIIKLSKDSQLYAGLITKAYHRLKSFETAQSRAEKILKTLSDITKKNKYV